MHVGLLEMPADELLDLCDPLSCLVFQPVREPLVELGAVLVGEAGVGGQLDEDVAESECR